MYSMSMCRDIGRAAAHTPLATVSPATLVRRRVETPVRPCRRLLALNPVTFSCKAEGDLEGREVCCQFTCQRQETQTVHFNMGDFAVALLQLVNRLTFEQMRRFSCIDVTRNEVTETALTMQECVLKSSGAKRTVQEVNSQLHKCLCKNTEEETKRASPHSPWFIPAGVPQ